MTEKKTKLCKPKGYIIFSFEIIEKMFYNKIGDCYGGEGCISY